MKFLLFTILLFYIFYGFKYERHKKEYNLDLNIQRRRESYFIVTIFIFFSFCMFIYSVLNYDISFLLHFEVFKEIDFLYNLLNNLGYIVYFLLKVYKFFTILLCIFAINNIIFFVKLMKRKANNIHNQINKYIIYLLILSIFTFFNFL